MKISTKGRYALEAVLDLAIYSATVYESLKNVAERHGISENYLEQIFMELRRDGIVESIRGAMGGYKLARKPEEITAGEVIRAVEGPLALVSCISEHTGKNTCKRSDLCVTRILWQKISHEINKAADSVTIKDLVDYCTCVDNMSTIEYYI